MIESELAKGDLVGSSPTVYQQSVASPDQCKAQNLLDGITFSTWSVGVFCAETLAIYKHNWFQIDLKQKYFISKVRTCKELVFIAVGYLYGIVFGGSHALAG